MPGFRSALLLSSVATVALSLPAAAAPRDKAPVKPFSGSPAYVAGDMHNHTTCTDGSTSTSYLLDRSLGEGTVNGVPNFGLDWFTHGNHGGSGNRDCRFSDTSANLPGETTTYWTETLGQDIQGITIDRIKGDVPNPPPDRASMYRWQSIREVEYPIIAAKAKEYEKAAIEGLESIVPGHEHSDTAIIAGQSVDTDTGNADAMAEFEFRFDRADADTLGPVDGNGTPVWNGKSFENDGVAGHQKAVRSVQWLQQHAPLQSYYVPTHTERAGPFDPNGSAGWDIEHFRDFNNAGPTVAFGIEGPGHFAEDNHSYRTSSVGQTTYGGQGVYTAKLGGLWDGMLGEGRNTFIYVSSDWHQRGIFGARDRATTADFIPGEYSKLYVPNQQAFKAQSIIDGMRSGNSYSVTGDLIGPDFSFTASAGGEAKTMGETLEANPGEQVSIYMRMIVPASNNSPYSFSNPLLRQVGLFKPLDKPALDHVDLITGDVTGVIPPGRPGYAVPNTAETVYNPSTKVAETVQASTMTMTQLADGKTQYEFTTTLVASAQPMYVRARGTNMPWAVPYVTDSQGNPLRDDGIINVPCDDAGCPAHLPTVDGTRRVNFDVEAWSNLWFYANPIFIRPAAHEKLLVETNAELAANLGGKRQGEGKGHGKQARAAD